MPEERQSFNSYIADMTPRWDDNTGRVLRSVIQGKEIPVTNDVHELEKWADGLKEVYQGQEKSKIKYALRMAHMRWEVETDPGRIPWEDKEDRLPIDPKYSGMCKVYGSDYGVIHSLRTKAGLEPVSPRELAELPHKKDQATRIKAAAELAGVPEEEFAKLRVAHEKEVDEKLKADAKAAGVSE